MFVSRFVGCKVGAGGGGPSEESCFVWCGSSGVGLELLIAVIQVLFQSPRTYWEKQKANES